MPKPEIFHLHQCYAFHIAVVFITPYFENGLHTKNKNRRTFTMKENLNRVSVILQFVNDDCIILLPIFFSVLENNPSRLSLKGTVQRDF